MVQDGEEGVVLMWVKIVKETASWLINEAVSLTVRPDLPNLNIGISGLS